MDKTRVSSRINGQQAEFLCEPYQSLLECLRDVLGFTGTKEGCNDGNCGACSVLLNGRLVNSCLVLGVEIEGQDVLTVEGLADWPGLHPIQQAFIEEDAIQCGYCTPGVLLATKALLDREPDPSEERIRTWMAGNLCRCTGYDKIVRAVQSAAKRMGEPDRHRGPDKKETPPAAEGFTVIGTRPARCDAADKVTGRAIYGADIALSGVLHGALLRSPHAHARIRSIDTHRAEALDGVDAVVTGEDLPAAKEQIIRLGEGATDLKYLSENTLARYKVLYVGQAIAAVAARTPHIAEQAVHLIEVKYEVLPVVMDVLEAMKDTSPLLHEDLVTRSLAEKSENPSNMASHIQHLKGDPEKGFVEADFIVEREFRTATVHQSYIEPHAATAVWSPDGILTVYTTTQGSFAIRDQIAELLQYPMSRIRVIPTEIGGGFGGKNRAAVEVPAALLSRKSGRPVKIVMARTEEFTATGPGMGTVVQIKMGAKRTGQITAAQAKLYYEAGAYPELEVELAASMVFAPYEIPHGRIDGFDVVVNKPRTATYRAPSQPQAVFACEQVIDEIAEKVGMDPLELRLLNCAKEGTELIDGTIHESIGCREVLKAAQEHPHYRAPLQGPYRGRGVAQGYWGNWGTQSSCSVSVNTDGTVTLLSGSVDVTGTRTSLAMQAAEALGIKLEQVKPSVADTDSIGFTETSAGSRTTVATGQAVVLAARDVIARMSKRAAILWDVPVDTVSFHRGSFATSQDDAKLLSFGELAAELPDTGGPITGIGNIDVLEWGGAFGTHIVDVEVDPETGQITILRYTAVQDVGRAVHPGLVEGQMQGGVAQGIGWALYEGYAYDEQGRMLNPNLLDYKIPTAPDLPPIETVIVEVPYPKHPFGIRGVGENPIVPPLAAIANAIYRAIGKRIDQLPMTPARILEKTEVI